VANAEAVLICWKLEWLMVCVYLFPSALAAIARCKLSRNKQASVISDAHKECCIFEYLYRDASNYKAWGELLLSGMPSQNDIVALRARLESDTYFVAEQVGIPALCQELWEFGGPNCDDHALHEFVTIRAASEDERKSLRLFGNWSSFRKTFEAVTMWDYSLSPNFDLD